MEEEELRGEWRDLTLTVPQVMSAAMRWLLPITAMTFLPYLLLWGMPDVPGWSGPVDHPEAVGCRVRATAC